MPTPEGPFTIDPVKDAFRKMQKAKPSRPGAGTINRKVVTPFTEDGREQTPSTSTIRTGTRSEQRDGTGAATRRKISKFYEEGLAESERLQKRSRRTSY